MRFPDLGRLLGDIPWALVGAGATRLYMPERATSDMDVLVSAKDAQTVRARLAEVGAASAGDPAIGGSSWRLPNAFPVDIIESADEWCVPAIAAAQLNRDQAGLPVLPLSYLVLMKFRAGRVQDLADITRMLGQASEPQLAETRSVFARHEPDGTDDLESMVQLGRLEMADREP